MPRPMDVYEVAVTDGVNRQFVNVASQVQTLNANGQVVAVQNRSPEDAVAALVRKHPHLSPNQCAVNGVHNLAWSAIDIF